MCVGFRLSKHLEFTSMVVCFSFCAKWSKPVMIDISVYQNEQRNDFIIDEILRLAPRSLALNMVVPLSRCQEKEGRST